MAERPLEGKSILVTRPAEQAAGLAERIRAAGGNPIVFPALEIRDLEDLRPLAALIERLDEFDLAIFISPSAVEKAMNLIAARRALPARLAVAALGPGSVRALARFGVRNVIAPVGRFDSEALLARPELAAVSGKRVVIFRGEGGRELLGETLRARGARVEYAECYRRAAPERDAGPLLRAWARGEVHAVTVTSSEGLHNLYEMLGALGRTWLRSTPLFAPHPKIAEAARALGLEIVIVTAGGDEGLVAGLAEFFATRDAAR